MVVIGHMCAPAGRHAGAPVVGQTKESPSALPSQASDKAADGAQNSD
jgi:hypothetical protein